MPPVEFLTSLVENLRFTQTKDQMLASSYRDFHAKGLDYVNLHRSPNLTVKAYILNDEVPIGVNVVNPHDHAYNFSTFILDGVLENVNFQYPWGIDDTDIVREWFKHNYRTPLGGKGGLTLEGPTQLHEIPARAYGPGQHYYLHHSQVHTIRKVTHEVVMLLFQYKESEEARVHGTSLYLPSTEKPDVTGLYNRFTDESLKAALSRIDTTIARMRNR